MDKNNVSTIRITKEALHDLERLINIGNKDGLTEVFAQYLEDENKFNLTLTYVLEDGQTFDRFITINLE